MWGDLLVWAQEGIALDRFSTPGMALLAAFGLGVLFGAVPAPGSELLAIAAGAVTPTSMIVPLLLLLTLGHVTGKLLWYWLGTFGSRLRHPQLRAWIAKAEEFNAQHPRLELGVLLMSALVSLPPFHLMAIGAGVVRLPIWVFVGTALVGRLLRFGMVAMVPGAVRFVL